MLQNVKQSIRRAQRKYRLKKIDSAAYGEVLEFCRTQEVLRDGRNCSQYLNGKYSSEVCQDIIDELFEQGRMGAYCIDNGDPQPHMQSAILRKLPDITGESRILEIGPGNLPLFQEKDYPNWVGLDYNLEGGVIYFSGHEWGKDKYRNIYQGSWETLAEDCHKNGIPLGFDLICGCHSFEHSHKPVTSIRNAAACLKEGGHIVIFVPDGYSTWMGNYDKTHTMYLDEGMIDDLFAAAGGFENIKCEQFRTNMDLMVIAKKVRVV